MTYDLNKHRYILTQSCLEEEGNISIGAFNTRGMINPAKAPQIFLDKTSAFIYRFIYGYTSNQAFTEYKLAKSPRLRNVIKDAMIAQAIYFYDNGDIGAEAGVNLVDGRYIESVHLRGEMRISPDAYDILRNAGLLYSGTQIPMRSFKYREGY